MPAKDSKEDFLVPIRRMGTPDVQVISMTDTDSHDIRWKQRFVHFRKAFLLLKQTMPIEHPSDTERAGLIHYFEKSFELARKVLKDYLKERAMRSLTKNKVEKYIFTPLILARIFHKSQCFLVNYLI